MTQVDIDRDEIISLATEAGLCSTTNGFIDWIDAGPSLHEMTLFAKLVMERERERIANKVDELGDGDPVYTWWVAEQIRAEGAKQ